MQVFKSKIQILTEALKEFGTQEIPHARGASLYNHLIRVQKILESWGCTEDVQCAGLYHSLYSTAFFKEQVLSIADREKLQKILGERAERLVYLFALLDRDTILYSPEQNAFSCKTYATQESLSCDYEEGVALIHILLANDIDHIDIVKTGTRVHNFKKYQPLSAFLVPSAQKQLNLLLPAVGTSHDVKPYVRFIGHSGVHLQGQEQSVVIDPWLFDSIREKPLVESLDPTQRSIDYLIPEPKNTPADLSPDIVCLSHFHTHHSPLQEIIAFATIKPITVICPILTPQKLSELKYKVGNYIFERIHFIFVEKDEKITLNDVHIDAFAHMRSDLTHLMFHVRVDTASILHIVDATANIESPTSLSFSESWKRIDGLRPDFLFIGAAGHIEKRIVRGVRSLYEASTLTPVQAAEIAARSMPKNAGIIGIYNHSVWDDRHELGMSSAEAEHQFQWGLSFLAPSVHIRKLLPGDTFPIGQ